MKENRHTHKVRLYRLICIITALILIGAAFTTYHMFHISKDHTTITLEAGAPVPQTTDYYISGSEYALSHARLNVTKVDTSKVGTYTATVSLAWTTFTYDIKVVDTKAPVFKVFSKEPCLAIGRDYAAKDLVDEITDNSGGFTVTMEGKDIPDHLNYKTVGTYTITLVAKDASGNTASQDVTFTVDTAPVIKTGSPYYITLGSAIDLTNEVWASDDVDGDLSSSVLSTIDNRYLGKEGDYNIQYSVRDSNGLLTETKVPVHVVAKKKLEDLIGERKISRKEYRILGITNLYDSGVSSSEDLNGESNYMLPASVHFYAPISNYSWAEGSGFVIDITKDKVYVCTCKHVTENAPEWTVFFYDGSSVTSKEIYESKTDDVAIVALPLSAIKDTTMQSLMTVHMNTTYWGGLSTQRKGVFMNILGESGLAYTQTGYLMNNNVTTPLVAGTFTQYEVTTVAGNSGSALFDGYGNLMGMVKFITLEGDTVTGNYAVRLPDIIDNYEDLTGNNLYTY